jgi:exodeoxyribonuclease-3
MRLVAWNCNMALHRKVDALLSLRPDVAVISECAEPQRLREKSKDDWIKGEPVWMGRSLDKGLGVFAFNGYSLEAQPATALRLRYILPVRVTGPACFNLLAVWAQNASAGIARKREQGPLRRALTQYRSFMSEGPAVIAGDWNSNAIWDKPGWQINHMTKVEILARRGLVSVYHARTNEAHGEETMPTLYWRDRRKDGPTYHIDFIFAPEAWIERTVEFQVGSFEDWCGNGLSDHVPIVMDVRT